MSELVGIREAARRLGVSDTAVHKAVKSGRVVLSPKSQPKKPLLDWEVTKQRWADHTDGTHRSHVGPQGSPRRERDAPEVKLPTSASGGGIGPDAGGVGSNYAASRAVRETFAARLAKLEFEKKSGKMVSTDAVYVEAFKTHRKVRDAVMNIPAQVCQELAVMDDPVQIEIFLSARISAALRELSRDIYTAKAAA